MYYGHRRRAYDPCDPGHDPAYLAREAEREADALAEEIAAHFEALPEDDLEISITFDDHEGATFYAHRESTGDEGACGWVEAEDLAADLSKLPTVAAKLARLFEVAQ